MPKTHSGSRNEFAEIYNKLLTEFKRNQTGYASIAIIPKEVLGQLPQ